jgi:hypothetical protein
MGVGGVTKERKKEMNEKPNHNYGCLVCLFVFGRTMNIHHHYQLND